MKRTPPILAGVACGCLLLYCATPSRRIQQTPTTQRTPTKQTTTRTQYADATIDTGDLVSVEAEHEPQCWFDFDDDNDVDGTDFLVFAACFNGASRPPRPWCSEPWFADVDLDADVDGFDYLTFALCFNAAKHHPANMTPGGGCPWRVTIIGTVTEWDTGLPMDNFRMETK